MVSVIIPVYNVDKYLDRCLESVVSQTYKDLEIIIINDGSEDASESLCLKWKDRDPRIKYFKQNNKGLGPARNLGITKSTSEYIAFLDSDDWWEINTVEELITTAKENNADMVYMNFYYSTCLDDGTYVDREFVEYCQFDGVSSAKEHPELVFAKNMRMWSKLFRRKLFVDYDVFMPAHPYEDFPVMPLLILLSNSICQVRKPLYHYFVNRENNISGDVSNVQYIPDGLEELRSSLTKLGFYEKYQNEFKEYVYRMCKESMDDTRFLNMHFNERKKIENKYRSLLLKYCKEKLNHTDKKVYVLGSYSSYLVSREIFFVNQIIGCNIDLDDKDLIYNNLRRGLDYDDRIKKSDIIILDLLPFFRNYKENVNREGICEVILKKLKDVKTTQTIVVMEFLLAKKFGISKDESFNYPEVLYIERANKILNEIYADLKKELKDKKTIFIELGEQDNYTYTYTKYGCIPIYYNWIYHKYASKELLKAIDDLN